MSSFPQSMKIKNTEIPRSESLTINKLQLLLAEKRTSLSTMRTGIAILALPISVLSVLIATSRLYDITQVLNFLIPLLIILTILAVLGLYLIIRSIRKIIRYDHHIQKIKERHEELSSLLDWRTNPDISHLFKRRLCKTGLLSNICIFVNLKSSLIANKLRF